VELPASGDESESRRRSKSWIEIGRSIEEGKLAAREFLLSELDTGLALLDAAAWTDDAASAARRRAQAREMHDLVLDRLPRVGLRPEQEGEVIARATRLRLRLEALGERL
jgi:hypothetical protein